MDENEKAEREQKDKLLRLPAEMRARRQWCITPGTETDKAPRTVDGHHASVTNPNTWTDFDSACRAAKTRHWYVGFVFTASDPFACIDLDVRHDTSRDHLDRYQAIANGFDSYTEVSRSGLGLHILLLGSIGPGARRDGVEVYSQDRFLICTGNVWIDRPLADKPEMLANMVSRMRPTSHGAVPPADQPATESDDDIVARAMNAANGAKFRALAKGQWADLHPSQSEADMALMSILAFYSPNNEQCRRLFRLTELGKREKAIKNDRYLDRTLLVIRARQAEEQARTDTFRTVFSSSNDPASAVDRAASANTLSTALPPPQPAHADNIQLEWSRAKSASDLRLEFLVDPFLPTKCVVGFFGRGSTAKSSFVATLAAHISVSWSTLWVSVEELTDWITQRHIYSGGHVDTLAVATYVPLKRDSQGRIIGSTFDVYRDLEASIIKARAEAVGRHTPPRPLRLVVLDTAVGLTGWAKGESPNDDAAVKRLLGHLQALAVTYDLCIAIIGHSNKGKHDHFADTVAGSSAWTNSPRLSFVHARDRREEFGFVMRVAKSNLSSTFAVTYKTEPVLQLHQHQDGHASVICRVLPGPLVWGEDEASDLFEAATRVTVEGESGGQLQRTKVVEDLLISIVELVYASDQPVSRDMVERKLGRTFGRREWKKVDDRLTLAAFQYRVQLSAGPNNKILYRRQPPDAA